MIIVVVKHVPNAVTLARPVLTSFFVYFILHGNYMRAILVFAAICLTDIFDGIAARALAACTRLGAYMDVSADLLYAMASLVVLNIKGLAPPWFTAVTALKFVEFAVTSSVLNRSAKNKSAWIFDGLGRCFSTLTFIAPGVFCFAGMYPRASEYVVSFLLVPACALAAASSAVRVTRCVISVKIMRCIDNEQSDCTCFDCASGKINRS